MPKKFWWPTTLSDQITLLQNFLSKIGGYATQLELTAAEVTAVQNMCNACINTFNFTESCKAAMKAATQWRELICFGEPTGSAIPAPPTFPIGDIPLATRGVVTQFFTVRDQIVAADGYTMAIGEDLGIVGAEITPPLPADVTPNLKPTITMGNTVNINGSMQGMDALRIEYAPKGGTFSTIAFLTNTPGGFQITPTAPNQAETGVIRAVFIKKNVEFGNFSPNYPVTVSA